MQQSREPLLSPLSRRSAHAAQSLGHSCSALCRWSVGLRVVLLGLPPSLRRLRRGLPLFVRLLHRYYAAVRLLHYVHARITARRLRGPVYHFDRRSGGLQVLVHVVSRRARVFDHAASRPCLAIIATYGCCLPAKQTVSARGSSVIGAQSPGPPMPLSTLRHTPHDAPRKTRGRNRVAAPFP